MFQTEVIYHLGLVARKPDFVAINKGADQSVHPRSLITNFLIISLESILTVAESATYKMSRF